MNRSRFPNSNDPSFIDARRTAAIARATSASVILVGILAVGVMTACSPRIASSSRVHEAVSATPAQSNNPATSAKSIERMRLDSDEVRTDEVRTDEQHKYMMYVYG
jgi:uncharacterized protein YpuA (DUF1002 family)